MPEAITVRRSHSADVFGCGPNFRVVVLFGGGKSNRSGDELSETTFLLLGECTISATELFSHIHHIH